MSHFNIFHMVKPLMVVPFHVYPMVNQSPIHMVNQKNTCTNHLGLMFNHKTLYWGWFITHFTTLMLFYQ